MTQDDVSALVKKSRSGDKDAFSTLVVQFQDVVYNMAFRRLGDADAALDAAQETFVKAFSTLEKFRGESSFRTWLLAIALREAENQRRSKTRQLRRARPIGQGEEFAANGAQPAASAEVADDVLALERALQEADAEDAKLILLRDIENLTYLEISEALEVPLNTVRSGLHRARARLRAALERVVAPPSDEAAVRAALPHKVH